MAQGFGLQKGVEGLMLARGAAAVWEYVTCASFDTSAAPERKRGPARLLFGGGGVSGSFQLLNPRYYPRLLFQSKESGMVVGAGAADEAACRSLWRSLSYDYSGTVALLRRTLAGAPCIRRRKAPSCFGGDEATERSSGSSGRPEFGSEDHQQPYGIPATNVPDRWDVVGLGQAMVDFSASVGDGFLHGLGLVKGTRKVVNHEERGKVLRALDGCSYKVTAGGSLSNTLVGLARLGIGYNGDIPLNVAMTGSVGSDPLGDFYRTKLLRANVHFLSEPIVDGTTGTVTVCTTPDAQRTMLSYQGMSSIINFDKALEKQISMSRVLVVEGYLWELSETIETIARACKKAREQGILVALTASDISCVKRHREKMWDVMAGSADILFTNSDEARALLGCDSSVSPATAAKLLSGYCPLVSVTDGAQGSYIGLKGEISYIQPAACLPVDTCGAGDAYAAGILYGLLRGVPDLKGIGNLAARVAAVVVGQQGTRLREEDARELAASVPTVPSVLEGLNLRVYTGTEQSVNA